MVAFEVVNSRMTAWDMQERERRVNLARAAAIAKGSSGKKSGRRRSARSGRPARGRR